MNNFNKIILIGSLSLSISYADTFEMDFEALLENVTDIATKKRLNVDNTPGVISIVKGEDLSKMGISYFDVDTLNMIPGFVHNHSRKSDEYTKYIYAIDGLSINTQITGPGYLPYISTKSIDRIEIIRGPSSSLYGANAYSAFINIITKKDGNIIWSDYTHFNGSNIGISVGTVINEKINDIDVNLRLHKIESDGSKHIVTQDMASLNNMSSNTPSEVNLAQGAYDIGLNLKYKDFEITYNRLNTKAYSNYGFSKAFLPKYDDNIHLDETKDILDISHKSAFYNWDITNSVGFFQFDQKISDSYIAPSGIFGAVDYIVDAHFKEQNFYAQSELNRKFNKHDILIGAKWFNAKLKKDDYFATINLNTNATYNTPSYVGDLMPDINREVYSLWLQDYYNINDSTTMVSNIRYDKVTDIDESTITPRLALIHELNEKNILKAQYSKAFMTPLFFALYPASGVSFMNGDKNLKIDKSNNYELAHIYKNLDYSLKTTLYYTDMYRVNTLKQVGNTKIQANNSIQMSGIEVELEKNFSTLNIKSNFSYNYYSKVKYIDEAEYNKELRVLPDFMANLIITKKLNSNLSTTLWYNYIAKQKQYNSDSNKVDDLHLVNLSLTYLSSSFKKNLSLTLSANDIFDEQVADISANNTFKSDEYIRVKRNFLLQLAYKF